MLRWTTLLALLALLLTASPTVGAADGIRRCVDADGGTIYTDRACDSLDAVEAKPRPAPTESVSITGGGARIVESSGPVRSDCARRTDTLLFDIRRAIEQGNVNHLAGVYHWPGTSGRSARYVMDRLQTLADHPGATVELVYPEVTPVLDDPESFPPGTPTEDPQAVRVTESAFDGTVPLLDQQLRLVRNAECWWVRF
jgi:hypothetical protein